MKPRKQIINLSKDSGGSASDGYTNINHSYPTIATYSRSSSKVSYSVKTITNPNPIKIIGMYTWSATGEMSRELSDGTYTAYSGDFSSRFKIETVNEVKYLYIYQIHNGGFGLINNNRVIVHIAYEQEILFLDKVPTIHLSDSASSTTVSGYPGTKATNHTLSEPAVLHGLWSEGKPQSVNSSSLDIVCSVI